MDEQERLHKGWVDLRSVCFKAHKSAQRGAPPTAGRCPCGYHGGRPSACRMYNELRQFIKGVPDDGMPREWRERLRLLKETMP